MKGIILTITCLFFLQRHPSLHAAPPIETCSYDSIQVEDTCKCDPRRCSKPPCQYELNIAVNGTDIPGKCCTIYSCDGCTNDTMLHGQCPCVPGAILNLKGECKCIDPHKKLKINECVCDPNLCELPQLCSENYVSVVINDECCSRNKCIKCPDDSYNNSDAPENKCVCYPCRYECGPNEKVVIVQHGKGFPGYCCDLYKCEKSGIEQQCTVGGIVYDDGDVWDTSDGQSCNCQGGISFCTKQNEEENFNSCHKEGSVYKHNESWMLDSCTNCTCFNGETKCIAHMCEVSEGHIKKPECQPLNCSKNCPDGYRVNKRGCKICKCNYSYKYDDILQKYNITKNQLRDILDDYFNPGTTEPTFVTTTITTNTSEQEIRITTPVNKSDDEHLLNAIIWALVGFFTAILLISAIYVIQWMIRRKKGSYDTNPARSTIYEKLNLTNDPLFNNNYIAKDNKNEHKIKGSI